nr:hypothetical protein GCM10025699_72610 [Microbacterium flavescens]
MTVPAAREAAPESTGAMFDCRGGMLQPIESTASTLSGPISTGTPSADPADEYVTSVPRYDGWLVPRATVREAPSSVTAPTPYEVRPSPTRGAMSIRVSETGTGRLELKPEYWAS